MAWFITIEGGEGAGKSTLIQKLEENLRKRDIRFFHTREPGGTPVAEEIRETLLKPGRKLEPQAELFLYEAARADHVAAVIRPKLKEGINVLCDRFTHSSLAYQGIARGLGLEWVRTLNSAATQNLEPDAVIWLKLDPEIGAKRTAARGSQDRLDSEKMSFHEKVQGAFSLLASEDPERFIVLDASRSPDEVFAELLNHPIWRQITQ